eukprot:38123-Chlamydomonas_euryale.AAC.1
MAGSWQVADAAESSWRVADRWLASLVGCWRGCWLPTEDGRAGARAGMSPYGEPTKPWIGRIVTLLLQHPSDALRPMQVGSACQWLLDVDVSLPGPQWPLFPDVQGTSVWGTSCVPC